MAAINCPFATLSPAFTCATAGLPTCCFSSSVTFAGVRVWALVGALTVVSWLPMSVYATMAVVLLLVAAQDAWMLRRLPTPSVQRDLPKVMPVAVPRAVVLHLRKMADKPAKLP